MRELAQFYTRKYAANVEAILADTDIDYPSIDVETEPYETLVVILRLENRLQDFLVSTDRYNQSISKRYCPGNTVRVQLRSKEGIPEEKLEGYVLASKPYLKNGLLPWEAMVVFWSDDDGTQDHFVNPWEC